MQGAIDKLAAYSATVRCLRQSSVPWTDVLLFPVRRRMRSPRYILRLGNGYSISAPADELVVDMLREIWVERCYAPRGSPIVDHPSSTVVEIGANAGFFSMWVKTYWPSVSVVSLEPSPRMFAYLSANFRNNKLENATALEIGCAGASGTRLLNARGHEGGGTFFETDNYGSTITPRCNVEVWSLDEVFRRTDVRSCPLLKLDCEGAEYEILYNASDATLEKISNISMEYHVGLNAHGPLELMAFLERKGFRATCGPLLDEEAGYLHAWKEVSRASGEQASVHPGERFRHVEIVPL